MEKVVLLLKQKHVTFDGPEVIFSGSSRRAGKVEITWTENLWFSRGRPVELRVIVEVAS